MTKILIYFISLIFLTFSTNILFSRLIRNPFSFAIQNSCLYTCKAIAKLHDNSKHFAILQTDLYSKNNQNNLTIVKPGDVISNYTVTDILDDYLILEDKNKNELILILE